MAAPASINGSSSSMRPWAGLASFIAVFDCFISCKIAVICSGLRRRIDLTRRLAMRALVYAALMVIASLPAFAVDNFNLPGSDYANYGGGSALLCRHTCAADARCQAWTWVKPSSHCWLKFRVPPLV